MASNLLRSVGQIYSHFLCLNLGMIENVFTFQLIIVLLLPSIPLLIDTSYILVNRVCPPLLYDVVLEKITETGAQIEELKMLSLDKSWT